CPTPSRLPYATEPTSSFRDHPTLNAIHTLSLHDALPISPEPTSSSPSPTPSIPRCSASPCDCSPTRGSEEVSDQNHASASSRRRSEEHTSELQSRFELVCRLLLAKKTTYTISHNVIDNAD